MMSLEFRKNALSAAVVAGFLGLVMVGQSSFGQEEGTATDPLVPPGISEPVDADALEGNQEISVAPSSQSDPRVDRGSLAFFDKDLPDPRTIPSLFFAPWTQALIREYRAIPPGQKPNVQNASLGGSGAYDDPAARDPGVREISLGGIAYTSGGDWTIWFNGQRVTPKGLPEQVHDLHVTKDYIDVLWYDPYTNIVYPVRLRPHQRFNLDSRIFLPG